MTKHPPQRDGNAGTGAGESGRLRRNLSGLSIKPSYSEQDISDFDSARDLGSPGEYPFVRGVHQEMYRKKLWTIRQLGSLDSPAKANERIRQLIDMGATGVSICLDLPTIMGRDSDDPLAEGEVGSCGGVAIDTLEDMRDLLADIALEKISINFVSNSQSAVILAMFAAVAEERGLAREQLTGTMQNDILKEFETKTYKIGHWNVSTLYAVSKYIKKHKPQKI